MYIELKKWDSGDVVLAGLPATQDFILAADNNGAAVTIFGPAVGSQINERIGRRVIVRSVQVRGWWQPAAGATYNEQFSRLIIGIDTQANGTATTPTITELLGNGAAVPVASALSFNNLNNRSRFKILYDWKLGNVVMNGVGTLLAPGANSITIDWYKKVNFAVTFNSGTTGSPAETITNRLFAFACGTRTTTAAGQFTLQSRVRFLDP